MAKPTKVKYDVSVIMNVKVMVVEVMMMMMSTPRRSSWTCVSKYTLALR
jgi:hypothetical protein